MIKKRFTEAEIEKLQQIQWWNWDEATLRKNVKLLRSANVEALWDHYLRTRVD